MAYVKYTWQNLPNITTPISKANLDHLETQYEEFTKLYDAHSILMAILNDTPVVLTVAASRIVGRAAAGNIDDLTPAQVMAILSGGAATDFSMNTHKITSVTDPGANQDAATKKYVDDNIPTVTKEIYAPFDAAGVGGLGYSSTYGGVLVEQAGRGASCQLLVPQDFTAITDLEVIFVPLGTGADMHFQFTTYFGAYNGGEAYNAGSENEVARDIGATVTDRNLAHDIADLTTGLAAGDRLNVAVVYNATAVDSNAYVCGLRLKYS